MSDKSLTWLGLIFMLAIFTWANGPDFLLAVISIFPALLGPLILPTGICATIYQEFICKALITAIMCFCNVFIINIRYLWTPIPEIPKQLLHGGFGFFSSGLATGFIISGIGYILLLNICDIIGGRGIENRQ